MIKFTKASMKNFMVYLKNSFHNSVASHDIQKVIFNFSESHLPRSLEIFT